MGDEPLYRKHVLDEDEECGWCGESVRILYQVPDAAPTGESSFVCLDCLTDEADDDTPDDYPAFDANQLFF